MLFRSVEIAEVLMEPSKRARAATKRPARTPETTVSRETVPSAGASHSSAAGVSRETTSAGSSRSVSAGAASRENTTDLTSPGESNGAVSRETPVVVAAASPASGEDEGLIPVPGATFADLPVEMIVPNPRQPRQVFDDDDIAELAASIEEVGLLQPVVVRRVDGDDGSTTYELIMGERRLRAEIGRAHV